MIKIKICLANSIIKKKFFFIYNLNLIMKSFIKIKVNNSPQNNSLFIKEN